MPRPFRSPASLIALALVPQGCGAPPPDPVAAVESPLVGGVPDPGDPAVVLVFAQSPSRPGVALCSGSVIAPHVVLTAAHCLHPSVVGADARFGLFLGSSVGDPAQASDRALVVPVTAAHYDPRFDPQNPQLGHDVGVAIAESALPPSPLPWARALDGAEVAGPVRFVGYGITSGADAQGATAGVRRTATSTVNALLPLFLQSADPAHLPCGADSGAPALVPVGGRETIVALVSFGDAACARYDESTRLDLYAPFLEPLIAAADPGFDPPANSGADAGASGSVDGGAGGAVGSPAADAAASGSGVASATGTSGCAVAPSGRRGRGPGAIAALLFALLVARRPIRARPSTRTPTSQA